MDQLLYTVSECCRLLAIGRTKFYELAANGQIPLRKIGQKTVVAAVDLKRWADSLPTVGNQLDTELGRSEMAQAKARVGASAPSTADLTGADRG
jgi:excisionase family DNA binding protein